MSKRRKRIEALGMVSLGRLVRVHLTEEVGQIFGFPGEKLIRLVEHDPRADAVVRAAVVMVREARMNLTPGSKRLIRAVEHLKGKKR